MSEHLPAEVVRLPGPRPVLQSPQVLCDRVEDALSTLRGAAGCVRVCGESFLNLCEERDYRALVHSLKHFGECQERLEDAIVRVFVAIRARS